MKRFLIILTVLAVAMTVGAQVPHAFQYQAVIRDENGQPVDEQTIAVRISLLKSAVDGPAEFVEDHNVMTNPYGLITLRIGEGTVVSGDFNDIAWGVDTHFVSIEVDIHGGGNFVSIGTTQLLSVPFALFAEKSADSSLWMRQEDDIAYPSGRVGIGLDDPQFELDVNGQVNAEAFSILGEPLDFLWEKDGNDIHYTRGFVSIGTSEPLVNAQLFIDTPLPNSDADKDSGIFLQATDVTSLGYPLWIRGNTSTLDYGSTKGQTLGRLLRLQDLRFGPETAWDFGINSTNSLFLMGGSVYDFSKKLVVTPSGDMGIGTESPAYKLDVNGAINASEFFLGGNPFSPQWGTSGDDIFFTPGKVGVGKDDPLYDFDVAGTVNAGEYLIDGAPLSPQWGISGDDIYYNDGLVSIGTSTPLVDAQLFIETPLPTSSLDKHSGIFLTATDVASFGYPLWIRGNTSTLTYGTGQGQTLGRLLRLQDLRFGASTAWDFGINDSNSLFLMGGSTSDFTKKFVVTDSGDIGINEEDPAARLQISDGDIYLNGAERGVIMKSPDGNCWKLTVDNSGSPVFTTVTCP